MEQLKRAFIRNHDIIFKKREKRNNHRNFIDDIKPFAPEVFVKPIFLDTNRLSKNPSLRNLKRNYLRKYTFEYDEPDFNSKRGVKRNIIFINPFDMPDFKQGGIRRYNRNIVSWPIEGNYLMPYANFRRHDESEFRRQAEKMRRQKRSIENNLFVKNSERFQRYDGPDLKINLNDLKRYRRHADFGPLLFDHRNISKIKGYKSEWYKPHSRKPRKAAQILLQKYINEYQKRKNLFRFKRGLKGGSSGRAVGSIHKNMGGSQISLR